jgi:hypothetical protein
LGLVLDLGAGPTFWNWNNGPINSPKKNIHARASPKNSPGGGGYINWRGGPGIYSKNPAAH